MTRAMLRRPFTATRAALDNEAPEYYGKRRRFFLAVSEESIDRSL